MADDIAEVGKPKTILWAFKWFLIVLTIVWLTKVYLREPEKRPQEVCYLPYKAYNFVYVDVFYGTFLIDEQIAMIKASKKTNRFYFNCLSTTKGWGWLKLF